MEPWYAVLVYAVWFISTYYVVLFLVTLFSNKDSLHEKESAQGNDLPLVSIIVPAYNEEKRIGDTIASLKQLTYPRFEVLIVNDGSRDATSTTVRAAIKRDGRFRLIDNRTNRGKAACLNEGIEEARGEFVVTMDADSTADPGTIEKMLPLFSDRKVGAVTASIYVQNPRTLLDKLIELEYIVGLSLFLKILSFLDCVFVTPGPFSMYRRSTLRAIGGFDTRNITEDLEIAYRIHRTGLRIEHCFDARVQTKIPRTFRGIYVQRRRWYTGALHTMVQHRGMMLRPRHGLIGYLIPYTYVLIFSGMALFCYTIFLTIRSTIQLIEQVSYSGPGAILRLFEFNFDPLTLSSIGFVGLTASLTSLALLLIGMRFTGKSIKTRLIGLAAFPLLFFLYQLYWGRALIAVARGETTRWR